MPIPFLLLLAAASTAATVIGTKKSIDAQNSAAKKQQQQETLSTQRNRRQAIREFQIQRASALSSAAGAGAGFGSGVSGGIGGLSSQLGADLGYGSQMSGLSRDINRLNTAANNYSGMAQLGQVGMSIAGSAGFNPLAPFAGQPASSTNPFSGTQGGAR